MWGFLGGKFGGDKWGFLIDRVGIFSQDLPATLTIFARKLKNHLKQNTFPDHNMDYVTSIFTEFVSGLIQSIVTLFVIIILVVKIQGKKNFT